MDPSLGVLMAMNLTPWMLGVNLYDWFPGIYHLRLIRYSRIQIALMKVCGIHAFRLILLRIFYWSIEIQKLKCQLSFLSSRNSLELVLWLDSGATSFIELDFHI